MRVDHHNGAISLETTFPIPEGRDLLEAHGQGRAVGFLIQRPHRSSWAVVIHLDYPEVSMKSEVSPIYAAEADSPVSNLPSFRALVSLNTTLYSSATSICTLTERLVVIYNARHIFACEIPNFSHLPLGIYLLSVTPTCTRTGWYFVLTFRYITWPAKLSMIQPPHKSSTFNLYYVYRIRARGTTFRVHSHHTHQYQR